MQYRYQRTCELHFLDSHFHNLYDSSTPERYFYCAVILNFIWHYYFWRLYQRKKYQVVMIALKFIVKDIVNCWLSYSLSQPVEFDVAVMLYFLLQYVGIIQVLGLLKQVVPNLSVSVVGRFRKNSLEALAN